MPPVNVSEGELIDVRRHVRAVAMRTRPFDAWLGPASSFAPRNPTLHLEVHDASGAAEGGEPLSALREQLRSGPLGRPDEHPFVAHLTVRRRADAEAVEHARSVLPGSIGPWRVDAVTVLAQRRDAAGTRWMPVWEEPLGPPVVVGRGGVELVLRRTRVVEALGEGTEGEELVSTAPPRGALVVVAERAGEPGAVVARAIGRVEGDLAALARVEVAPAQRGQGISAQVLHRWCADAGSAGARLAVAEVPDAADAGLLERFGFGVSGAIAVRRLGDPSR